MKSVLILEENKNIKNIMTMENRGYYVYGFETDENLTIREIIVVSKYKKNWETGILGSACKDILARMNIANFQQINIKKR